MLTSVVPRAFFKGFFCNRSLPMHSAKSATESSGHGDVILSDDEETGSGDGGILPRASGEGFFGNVFIRCEKSPFEYVQRLHICLKWPFCPFPEIDDPFSPSVGITFIPTRLPSFCREKER